MLVDIANVDHLSAAGFHHTIRIPIYLVYYVCIIRVITVELSNALSAPPRTDDLYHTDQVDQRDQIVNLTSCSISSRPFKADMSPILYI